MLTFSNGVKLYMTGGTSTTKQMAEMADMEIDYAFYRCDGVYNMGLKEAARCAEPVEAKHNIPYHNSTSNRGEMFDRDLPLDYFLIQLYNLLRPYFLRIAVRSSSYACPCGS